MSSTHPWQHHSLPQTDAGKRTHTQKRHVHYNSVIRLCASSWDKEETEYQEKLVALETRLTQLNDRMVQIGDQGVENTLLLRHMMDHYFHTRGDEQFQQYQWYDRDILDVRGHIMGRDEQEREVVKSAHKEVEKVWDSYRASFTVVVTKGYLEAVEQLRERLMAVEWGGYFEKIALHSGVSQFESFCGQNSVPLSIEVFDELYKNPKDLSVIEDPHLRMMCRSMMKSEELKYKQQCLADCTQEARKLAQQFSEGEFLSKILPDPIEHGLVASIETLMTLIQKR